MKALIDGTELQGWDVRAAWDDFKIGLKHGNEIFKSGYLWKQKMARVCGEDG